jgi:hypothetical protein
MNPEFLVGALGSPKLAALVDLWIPHTRDP